MPKSAEPIRRIRELQRQHIHITNEIWEEAKKAFSTGDTVFFEKGGNEITAEILAMSGPTYPRFFIRSHTGKEYWVDLYHLIK